MEIVTTSTPMKALKASRGATPGSATKTDRPRYAMHDVLHLEIVMQRVLAALAPADLSAFLSAVAGASALAWLQEDTALWEELLALHFGGRRLIAAEAQAEQDEDGDDGLDGVMRIASDDEDEEDEDEDEGEDDEDEDDGEEQQHADQADDETPTTPTTSTEAAGGEQEGGEDANEPQNDTAVTETLPDLDLPVWMDKDKTCTAAREFMVSLQEWTQFQERVVVLRGDIGTIQDIDGLAIDAIAFPGNAMMRNPYNGAGSAVFRRAGRELDEHTSQLRHTLRAGQCHVTPGFNSGARVLIHCHGPYNAHARLYETLGKTYRNVLRKAKQENVACIAMTSISTGNFGVPIPQASKTAIRAIQQFMRAHRDWQGRVGIVCYEADVFEAFRDERQHLLDKFNAAQ